MKRVCVLLCVCILLLTGCNRQAAVPLTEEELVRANEAFDWYTEVEEDGRTVTRTSEISGFFTSFYSDPSQLDLEEFLRYCPAGTILEDTDAEEYRAVLAAVGIDWEKFPLPSTYFVPVHRYRKADVSALLKQYADITVDTLVNTEGTVYLEEYDSYYNFTSDFGPGIFACVAGEKQGDTLRFWSEEAEDGSRKVLTLREDNGNYFILSFEKTGGAASDPDSAEEPVKELVPTTAQ